MTMPVNHNLIMLASLVAMFLGCESSPSVQAPRQNRNTDQFATKQTPQVGNVIKLYPMDEAPQDRSFQRFREGLLKAARKHDAGFILAIVDPNIINGSDTNPGLEQFKAQWKPDEPDSQLWDTLITVLSMGGSFRLDAGQKEFCAPYVTSLWPTVVRQLPKNADPLDYEVIIGKNVSLRSAPSSDAPVVGNLSYDVVKVHADSFLFERSRTNGFTWFKVSTLTGEQGYVPDNYLRGAADYQACFKRARDKWTMTVLAARE